MSPPNIARGGNKTSDDYIGELTSQEDSQLNQDTTGATITVNGTAIETGPKIIVRTEEVLIVGLVLILWVGAIMLFFNRWGKIRMLEPYQPKFQQQHRSSCPLVDMEAVSAHQRASVSRMSMGMVHNHNLNMPTCQFAAYNPSLYAKGLRLARLERVEASTEFGVCGCEHESLSDAEAAAEDALSDGSALDGVGRERRAGVEHKAVCVSACVCVRLCKGGVCECA
ncbi:hypothetical protein KR215_009152 [Drosophila sulfurigaster]|nr:hypothetical protein KR215_009152 [Drosophila sulfurigaster]